MKTNKHFNIPLISKRIPGIALLLAFLLSNGVVSGAIFTARASGAWTTGTTWAVGGTTFPSAGDDVVIPSSYTVTLSAGAACRNLTLQGTTGTRLAIGNYTLSVYGYLMGPSTGFTNSIITTSTGGVLKFAGSTGRVLFNRWTAAFAGNWNCEVALNAGITGTINTTNITVAINLANLTISSGIFQVGTTTAPRHLYIDADGSNNGYGNISIASGANLIATGYLGTRSSTVTTYCGTTDIMGTLTMQGSRLNGTINIQSGGVLLIKRISTTALLSTNTSTDNFTYSAGSKLQYDLQDIHSGVYTGAEISQAQKIGIFSNLYTIVVNNPSIILTTNLLVNDTLKLVGNVLTDGNGAVEYGVNGTLYYKGTGSQQTGNLTFPATNGPYNLFVNNATGFMLHADRAINGTILVESGSIFDGQAYSISGTGSYTVESNATVRTSHPNGLSGTNATTGAASTYDPSINLVFYAPGTQITGNLPPTIANLTADGGTVLTLTQNALTCNSITVDNGSSLSLTAGYTLTCNGLLQVNSGSTFDANNVEISGAGSIVINNGATFATAHANGINGSDATTGGSSSYSTSANYTFNGSGSQVTGNLLPANIINLTVSNTSSLSLSQTLACVDVTVAGTTQLIVPPGIGLTSYGAATFDSPLLLQSSTTSYRSQMGTFIHDGYNDNSGSESGSISSNFRYTSNGSIAKTGRSYYISPSISDAISEPFNPAGNPFSQYLLTTRMWQKISNNTTGLIAMNAYGFRSTTSQTITVTGTPNTGDSYTINNLACPTSSSNNWYYMVGNPYPAVVNWDVISFTETTNLEATMYYRTSTSSGGMTTCTYNSYSGGVGSIEYTIDGQIAPMQAFWVKASTVSGTETASITISKSDRSHDWGTAPFLKSRALTKSKTDSDKETLRLFLYTKENIYDGILLVQASAAEDGYDKWDSQKMIANDTTVAELYTFSPELKKLVIQSIKPIVNEKIFPIGLINTIPSRQYTFKADLSKTNKDYNYFLEDKKLNVTQDLLLNSTYTFTSDTLNDNLGTRFVLHVLQTPTLQVSTALTVCSSQPADLTTPSMTSGSTEGLSFTYWKDSGATIPYLTPQNAESGTYYIKGTLANGAYKISYPIEVIINNSPTVIITNPLSATYPTTIDLTASEITVGSTSGLIYSYWLDADATSPYATPQVAIAGNYYIKGTIANTGCYTIAGPVTVIVNPITGVDTNPDNLKGIVIYSYGNQIQINNCQPNSLITIYDLLGQFNYSSLAKSTSETISCNLKTGVYIVKVINIENVKTEKVFIP